MGFSHNIQVIGRVSQKVVRYRLDSMGKGSMDEKVVVYGIGPFVKGVIQTRDYCISSGNIIPCSSNLMMAACTSIGIKYKATSAGFMDDNQCNTCKGNI